MKQEIKAQWIAALRSGEYKQGDGYLHRVIELDDGAEDNRFCCLGVLCDLAVKAGAAKVVSEVVSEEEGVVYYGGDNSDSSPSYLPNSVRAWSEVGTSNPYIHPTGWLNGEYLADLNDQGKTFAEIADLIEEYL